MQCLTLIEAEQWRISHHCKPRSWKGQATFVTPLGNLPWFSAVLAQFLQGSPRVLFLIDAIIFDEPNWLHDLRDSFGEKRSIRDAPAHVFENEHGAAFEMLEMLLSDWIDFRVIFDPDNFAISADHDEFTTVFARSAEWLEELEKTLVAGGVRRTDYDRKFP